MSIDLKRFSVYVNAAGRAYAAQREIRGAYRKPGQGLHKGYVKPPKALKYNPGVKSGLLAAGIGGKKVLVWEEIKGRWNGNSAIDLYKGPILRALKKAFPSRKKFTILEDNDPRYSPFPSAAQTSTSAITLCGSKWSGRCVHRKPNGPSPSGRPETNTLDAFAEQRCPCPGNSSWMRLGT